MQAELKQGTYHLSPSELAGEALMSFKPINSIHQHFCAFHVYSHDQTRSVEAHHFCTHVSADLHQCVIYDSDEPGAKLIGVEYIVSEKVFKDLPPEEKRYWHSHKYEIESGLLQLMVKGAVPNVVTDIAEHPAMLELQQTYGKTIHTWAIDSTPDLPLGPPHLMMSFTYKNPHDPSVVRERDDRYGVATDAMRDSRKTYLPSYDLVDGVDDWEKTGKAIVFKATESLI